MEKDKKRAPRLLHKAVGQSQEAKEHALCVIAGLERLSACDNLSAEQWVFKMVYCHLLSSTVTSSCCFISAQLQCTAGDVRCPSQTNCQTAACSKKQDYWV